MDYISLDTIPHFTECALFVKTLGFRLVELQIVPLKNTVRITVVIASENPSKDIGVSDCAKVHKPLQAKLISILNKTEDDISMEVCSPGMERNFKNAAEFTIFTGREVRVWDKNVNDWISGIIKVADDKTVTLEVIGDEQKVIAYNDIAKAKFIHG